MSHQNSRIVTIFRAGSFLSRAQGPEVDDMFADSKQGVGSYFEKGTSSKIGSGLTRDEEELLMPDIINVKPEDRDFKKLVNEYFQDINTPIPHGTGLALEIGLENSNDKQVSKTNMPISIPDFVRYRHAKGHPWMALSKEEASGNQLKHFYIFDKSNVQASANTRRKELDAAMQVYLKIKNEESTVDQMLTLLGTDPREFTGNQAEDMKIEALRERLNQDPAKFAKIYNEGDLEIRYAIKTMINTGVFKEVGTRLIDNETQKLIGNTLEEVIYWFKDETNSDSVIALKARMQEALAIAPKKDKRRTVKATK